MFTYEYVKSNLLIYPCQLDSPSRLTKKQKCSLSLTGSLEWDEMESFSLVGGCLHKDLGKYIGNRE